MAKRTYWVEYTYTYDFWDTEKGEWDEDSGSGSGRFYCNKANMRRVIEKAVDAELKWLSVKNVKVYICDWYVTTDYEV